ncbi:HAMP domain-containing histidine kinase [Paenibacillus sp. USDA918EY]|uniref:HAMP domain-containing histidine kinase n=1 Tax=Paenibacillus sp. USDA918EY TaxID=2689575 RepID=UPI001357B701|nr:HAMP domain-containing histidine kinase [Paenibacillus sp. USDA918EY]
MRLFFRDQAPLVAVYFLQLFLVTLVYWLDGSRHLNTGLYAGLLSVCLLSAYLVIRYIRNRTFYARLAAEASSTEELLKDKQQTPLAQSLQRMIKLQHRRYQTDLQQYKHKIESHMEFIHQWVHQMKTPLSVIHLMIRNRDEAEFAAIGDELDRIRKGLDIVLYTARLDTFERDFHVETLDLRQVVREVTSSQKRLFIRSHVFPLIRMDEPFPIASDEKWLGFVLTQLITNAVRYTRGENRKIVFYSYCRDERVVLEVQDEGVGIPKGDLPRIFEPYFTGENGREFRESTGMGLYLAKQICGKLGHDLQVESEAGKGTTVRIIF